MLSSKKPFLTTILTTNPFISNNLPGIHRYQNQPELFQLLARRFSFSFGQENENKNPFISEQL